MALEWRGNNCYFYEKERSGGKVRSVYAGKGETALMFHWLREDQRQNDEYEKESKKRERMREIERENEIDSAVEAVCEMSRILIDAFFLTNGFHQHKRQWRKKRNGKAE